MAEDLKKLVEKGISRGYSLEKIQSDFANAGWGEAYLNNIPVYYNEFKKKSPVGAKDAGVLPSRQGDTRFSSESQLQQDKYAGVGNIPLSDPLLKKKDGLADSLFKIINQSQKDADNTNKYVPQIKKLWNDYSSIERGQKETQDIFDERGRINKLALSSLNASAKRNSDRVKEEAKAIAKDDGVLETAARGFYGGILGAADYVANLFDPDTYDDQPDAPDSLGLEAKRQLERAQKASLGRKLSAGYTEKQIEDGFIGNFSNGNYGAAFDLFGRDLIEVLPQSAVGFIPYVGLPLMAASAGGGGWQAVKDDDKYSTLEKFLYAPLVGAAEYATEKFFGMDRRMVQKGLSEAFGKTIKSGADIPKKELGDMLFGGIPKAVRSPLEEGLEEGIVSTFTQTLDKIMADKPFDPVEIAESVMLGAGAGGSTYALVRGGSALLQTPVFNDVYTITNNVNKINQLLQSDDIVPEEKEILSNRLNQFKTQLNQLRNEASDYYKPFSQEDKQKTLELNQAITKGMKTYGAMKTPEAKAEVVNTIRQSLAEKAQIEQKYDSTQKQQVPSAVVQGAQPGGVPIQGTSAEAPQAGGVLQVPSQQEEEIASKTKVIENSSPAFSFKPVSVTLTENNAPEVIGNITTYVDTIPDELFKTLSTSRQEVMNGVESISNVISSLSKSGRQIPVTVYATEDAWKRGTGQPLSRGIYVPESEVEGQPSSISVFLPAIVGNTVYHEGLHDVVPKVFGTKGIETVAKRLSQAVKQDPLLAAQLGQFVSNYEQSDKAEEFLAELGSRVSAGDIDIEVTKSLATRFMEAVASVLGAVGIKMSPNASQLSRAFLEYAQKLGAGVELGEIENMLEGNTEPGPVANTQKIKKPTKYQDIIETKDSYNLSYVNPTNVVDIEKLIDEIVSEGKNVLFWAGDQIGVGQYTDPFTKKKYDLQGGPSYMLNPTNVKRGAVWASNIEPNTFNDILLNKKPDYVFIVSGEETSMMFFNKTVGNIWIDRAKSKFNDISSFKEAFGKVTKGVEYKTISGYNSWDELRNQLEKKVNTKADTTDVNIAKSLIKAIAGMSTASSVDFLNSYGLTIKQFNDLRDGYFKENNFGMLDITTIYKPKELIEGDSNHLTYRNVLMGELVGVPNRKLSSKDIMTDEFMLGTTGKGFVRKDLPDAQLIKAIAPDTPGIRAVARPRKVMRMALEGYNEKPQAMAGQRLFNEPLKEAVAIADEYYEKEFNEARPKFNGIKSVDKERAKKISNAYVRMEDNYFDPEVKKAYDAMIDETLKQFDFIVDKGYKVVINNKDDYKTSEDMISDLRDNKVMRIFSTESGFGDDPITENQRDSNPLLKDSGRKDKNGVPLLNNDLFRFVHDFFGHAELGNGFGAVGEENAWNVHARMYSPLARKAMTSETRGQNSYVNFSGINEEVFKIRDKAREERKKGNEAEADKLLGEVKEKMKFADQKVGLLPEEMAIPDGFEDTKPKVKRMALTDTFKEATAKALEGVDITTSNDDLFNKIKGSKWNSIPYTLEQIVKKWDELKNVKNDNIDTIKYLIDNPSKNPIVLNSKGDLIDGHHRVVANKISGISKVKYVFDDGSFDINEPFTGNVNKNISEAYYKAKADGSNPKLVQDVEDLLGQTAPKVKRMAIDETFKNAAAPSFITEEDRREFQSMSLSDTQDEANDELWAFVQRRNFNEEQVEEVLQSELWDEVSDSVKQNEEKREEEAYYEKNPHEKQLEEFSDKMEAYKDFDFAVERAGTGTSYVTISKLSFDKNGKRSKEDVAQIRFANHMRAYNPKNPDIANYDIGPDYNTTVDGVIKRIVGDAKPKVKESGPTKKAMLQIIGSNADLKEWTSKMLLKANEMERRGVKPKTIFNVTGWERGADKKWKYPVPPFKLDYTKVAQFNEGPIGNTVNLYDLIENNGRFKSEFSSGIEYYTHSNEGRSKENEDVFDFYPSFANMKVTLSDTDGPTFFRYVKMPGQKALGSITISKYWHDKSPDHFLFALTHEIQHAVQREEGFAVGGSVATIDEEIDKVIEEDKKILANKEKLIPALKDRIKLQEEKVQWYIDNGYSQRDIINDGVLNTLEGLNIQLRMIEDTERQLAYLKGVKASKNLSSKEKYVALAGEIEANNAAKRAVSAVAKGGPTIQMLVETEDIPREYQIIITPDIEEVSSPAYLKKLKAQKIVESQERLTPKVKRQVTAWHGSPYDFETFKSDKIGTGEGAQAFGWGLYFTDLESIAKEYASHLSNYISANNLLHEFFKKEFGVSDNVRVPEYQDGDLSSNGYELIFIDTNYFNNEEVSEAFFNNKGYDKYLKQIKKELEVVGDVSSIKYNKDYDQITVRIKQRQNKYLYGVSLHKGKTPDQYTWLDWYRGVDRKTEEKVQELFEKEYPNKTDYYGRPIDLRNQYYKDSRGKILEFEDSAKGGEKLYRSLAMILGSDKEASLFLLRAGIDGIKYPAESIARGATSDNARGFNYVVFDENAVTIDKKIRFQKIAKAQGSQLEAQVYSYLLSISEKRSDNTYKLPFTLDDFLSYMVPTFSRQRATEIYENVSKGVTPEKVVKSVPNIDDAYDASKKLLDSQKNKKMFTWDAARKFFLDRQATLKAAILKAGMKNAYNLLVNRAGSGARANYFFSKQEKAIYDGLSSKDIEALDKIIMLRRIAEIDKNFDVRGEKRPIHPNKLNFESAQIGLAEKRKELGDAKFNELNDRSNKYFDAFKSLLDSMYDEGLINEDLYNRLKDLDYQPRMFIEHVFDMDELSMRDINLSANQVKKIKDGSEDEIMFDSRFLLAVYSKSTFSRIARNKVNRAIAEATSVKGNEEWISKDPKKQFSEVTYFEDGVRKQFYIKSSLKGELDDVQRFGVIPPESQKYVGLLSGSYLLKLLATRANPLFVFRNVPRDYLHVLFFTNVYDNMNMPLAMYRLAGDAIKGVKGKIKDDQDYKDFIEYGGGMEYLSTEGKEGMMTNRGLLNKTIEKLGSAGELSEIAFRLGMYKRLVQESLKNFDGTPTEEQLAQIKVEAVTKSREMIDFAQGGVATKTLESAVPYINAAFQGFRVSSAYIKNNPKEFVIKLGQLAIGLAVIAMYNAVMGDDDMEDIPEDVKRRYFIIMTPFTEEKDGKTVKKYIKIAKTQQLIPFISALDMSLESNLVAPFMGRDARFNEETAKQSWDAFLSYFPKDPSKPLDEALSSVPLFSALAAYKMNYDTFRKRIISTDYQDKNVLPAYEDFTDKNVPYFYKAIGQAVDAGPKRLQVATEKFITTPYSSIITMGGYTLMDAIASNVYELKGPGGYTPAEQETISNKALKSAGINVEKVFIGTTDPNHKIYNKREQIERINLEASTERKGLKLQAKELGGKYFTAKEQGDSKGMNEALEAIKNARIEVRDKAVEDKNKQDYDYFNDALKTNMRFGPTFPQEYNDITFATDNEARAKIIAIRDMNMTQKELIDYLVDYKRKTGKSIDIRTIIREYDKFVTNEKK